MIVANIIESQYASFARGTSLRYLILSIFFSIATEKYYISYAKSLTLYQEKIEVNNDKIIYFLQYDFLIYLKNCSIILFFLYLLTT